MKKPQVAKTTGLLILVLITLGGARIKSFAQNPVKWSMQEAVGPLESNTRELILTAAIEPGWHIYSQFTEEGGPVPTHFNFLKSEKYSLLGTTNERTTPYKYYDSILMLNITSFSSTAVFSQKAIVTSPNTIIKVQIEYMACTNERCLPPAKLELSLNTKAYNEKIN